MVDWRPWPKALMGSSWRRDRQVACSRATNFIPTPLGGEDDPGEGGRRRRYYLGLTPGVTLNGTFFTDNVRAVLAAGDTLYVVHGRVLSSVSPAGVIANIQMLPAGAGLGSVTMAWSGPSTNIVAVAAGGQLHYYDQKDAPPTLYTDIRNDIDDLVAVEEFQSYFITLDADNQMVASPPYGKGMLPMGQPAVNAYRYDLTNFAQRSLTPDPWIAVKALADQLLLFGRRTMDVWQLKAAPGASFPLEPVQGAEFQAGAVSSDSISVLGDTAYWVGHSSEGVLRVWRFGSDGTEAVSTPAVDEWLQRIDEAGASRLISSSASAFAGRRVFTVRAPTAASWCFDETTGLWHERGVWDPVTNLWTPWDVGFAAAAGGGVWVCAHGANKIGRLSSSRRDFDGNYIRRQRITPHWGTGDRLTALVGVKASVGASSGRVEMAVSRDGGATFSSAQTRNVRRSRWAGPARSTVAAADGSPASEREGGTEELRWNLQGAGRDVVISLVMPGGEIASGGVIQDVWGRAVLLRG